MTPARVKAFLDESTSLHWPWEWLVLHGGEPTMHPQFAEICQLLHDYKNGSNPKVQNFVCTNGYGKRVLEQIEVAKKWGIQIANSNKDGSDFPPSHIPLSYSPIDLGEDYNLGCFQSSQCGIAYTNQGFYECSPAAAAHRVFGYEPMALRLADVTAEKLAEGFAKHCGHCGYARRFAIRGDKEAPEGSQARTDFYNSLKEQANPHAPLTPTWQAAVDAYKAKKAAQ